MSIKLHKTNKKSKDITIMRDVILGRMNDPQVIFIDDSEISRQHAKLYQKITHYKFVWFIEDLNSVNGTYVNGKRIISPTPLNDHDEIHLGQSTFTVTIDETHIWQGEGEYAPNLQPPFPLSTFIATQPNPKINSHQRQQLLLWELLGLVGILGIGWWRAGQSSFGILWFIIGLFVIIFATFLALALDNPFFCFVGWLLLLLLTAFSLLLLARLLQ